MLCAVFFTGLAFDGGGESSSSEGLDFLLFWDRWGEGDGEREEEGEA